MGRMQTPSACLRANELQLLMLLLLLPSLPLGGENRERATQAAADWLDWIPIRRTWTAQHGTVGSKSNLCLLPANSLGLPTHASDHKGASSCQPVGQTLAEEAPLSVSASTGETETGTGVAAAAAAESLSLLGWQATGTQDSDSPVESAVCGRQLATASKPLPDSASKSQRTGRRTKRTEPSRAEQSERKRERKAKAHEKYRQLRDCTLLRLAYLPPPLAANSTAAAALCFQLSRFPASSVLPPPPLPPPSTSFVAFAVIAVIAVVVVGRISLDQLAENNNWQQAKKFAPKQRLLLRKNSHIQSVSQLRLRHTQATSSEQQSAQKKNRMHRSAR